MAHLPCKSLFRKNNEVYAVLISVKEDANIESEMYDLQA